MNRFQIIAFTHSGIGLDGLSTFHWEKDDVLTKAAALKEQLNLSELMYLSTCNRIEFLIVDESEAGLNLRAFLWAFNSKFTDDEIETYHGQAKVWNGINAVNHLIEVASSLDSMVLGEREIISQVREAFDLAFKNKLAGDFIRICVKQTIATAKKIYTETDIAKRPVSVVSLAFQTLVSQTDNKKGKILVIGSGRTNSNLVDFLTDYGFKNFTVFNRTLENAKTLAEKIDAEAHMLDDLGAYKDGFDILLCCTGSSEHIITAEVYSSLLGDDKSPKIVVDLAVPSDLDPALVEQYDIEHISVVYLKEVSDLNLQERRKELIKVRQIIYDSLEEFKLLFRRRQMEIRMHGIPETVKEIRKKAIDEVFSKELDELDDQSRETVEKILNYMEKKYVSVPMIMAKEFAVDEPFNDEEQ